MGEVLDSNQLTETTRALELYMAALFLILVHIPDQTSALRQFPAWCRGDWDQFHKADAALLADNKVKWQNAIDSHAFPISLELRPTGMKVLQSEILVMFQTLAQEPLH